VGGAYASDAASADTLALGGTSSTGFGSSDADLADLGTEILGDTSTTDTAAVDEGITTTSRSSRKKR
jgi:hypothetical protein